MKIISLCFILLFFIKISNAQSTVNTTTVPNGYTGKQYWKTNTSGKHLYIETNIPYNVESKATVTLRGSAPLNGNKNLNIQATWQTQPWGITDGSNDDPVYGSWSSDGDMRPTSLTIIEYNGFLTLVLLDLWPHQMNLELDILGYNNVSSFQNSWYSNWKVSLKNTFVDGTIMPNVYADINDNSIKGGLTSNYFYTTYASSSSSFSLDASAQKSSSSSFNINPGSNNSLSFWGRNISRGFEPYSITMSDINQSYAGQVAGETNSDFNMYFRMSDQAARGFNFQNGPGNNVAGIDGYGNGRFIGSLFSKGLAIGPNITSIPNGYKMIVDGTIGTRKIKVTQSSTWADYVFNKNYKLKTINQLEEYIKQNKHLPNIPSTSEVTKNGYDLNEMDSKLLEKIEELTLYIIQQDKKITELVKKVKAVEEILEKK